MPTRSKKPCDLSCAKCGGTDIVRQLKGPGQPYDVFYGEAEWISEPWVKLASTYGRKYYARECIKHHCRTCHYEWATKPLKASA